MTLPLSEICHIRPAFQLSYLLSRLAASLRRSPLQRSALQ